MRTDVFFRADASPVAGGGHISRCLTLAASLGERGADIHFLFATLHRAYEEQIASLDFYLTTLPTGHANSKIPLARWLEADAHACAAVLGAAPRGRRILIVDHYLIDLRWEHVLRPCVDAIVVID